MERIQEILLRKNLPHVATLMNKNGDLEPMDTTGSLNIDELIHGMAELNKNGIVLIDIRAGVSREGVTKISDISSAGLYINKEWVLEPRPFDDIDLPEVNVIPFKSDSWALGEFIVKYKTGKPIPKRFMKSQSLLNKFCGGDDDEILRKLLVLDPEQREFTWNLVPLKKDEGGGCSIM
jgi:hypothetical protein